MSELEQREDVIGTGDDVTTMFSANLRCRPIEPGSVTVFPPTKDVSVNNYSGFVQLAYDPPPPKGVKVAVSYAWRPPRLRDAEVLVRLGNKEEWVSVRELSDAVHRGGYGRS